MEKRWIAIRVSAALAIAGSVGTLLLAVLIVFGFFIVAQGPMQESPVLFQALIVAVAVFLAGMAVWGMLTGVGIFRRREWARISIVVVAAVMTIMCGSGTLTILFIPFPETARTSPELMTAVRWSIAATYAAMTAVGIWWLVLFNRRSTQAYFAGAGGGQDSARPLSISVIAWYLLAGSLFTALAAVLRFPALVFGVVVGGWGALAVYTLYTAAQIYLGTGLLQLQDRARLWSIVYFAAVALNGVIFLVLPDFTGRLREIRSSYPRFMHTQPELPHFSAVWPFLPVVILLVSVPIWFLVRRRSAFTSLQAQPQTRS
jgi:hypothetical protein